MRCNASEMDSERGSARLAEVVTQGVIALHPTVTANLIPERDQQHFTIVEFVPRNRRGARVTFYANFDWSFSLESGRFVLFEDEEFHGTEADHIDRIIEEIDSIARHGVARSTLDRVISFGADRWRPWSD